MDQRTDGGVMELNNEQYLAMSMTPVPNTEEVAHVARIGVELDHELGSRARDFYYYTALFMSH